MFITKKIVPALAVVLVMGTAAVSFDRAFADTAKVTDHAVSASTPAAVPNTAIPQLSQMGYDTMRAVRGARIAIFNGDVANALKLVTTAQADIKLAEKDAGIVGPDHKFVMKDVGGIGSNDENRDRVVPIDGQIVLADNFVATPEKAAALKKANEHIGKGEHQKAAEVLKLASVDVSFSRVMMPLEVTQNHIDTAMNLIANKQYYEANLALKAAEDGIKVDTVSLVETAPKS